MMVFEEVLKMKTCCNLSDHEIFFLKGWDCMRPKSISSKTSLERDFMWSIEIIERSKTCELLAL